MTGLALAILAAYGMYLVFTALAFGWTGVGVSPTATVGRRSRRDRLEDWLAQAGLDDVEPGELLVVVAVLAIVGAGLGYAAFGGAVAAAAGGVAAASVPVASAKQRRERRMRQAREAWPHMIEEVRLQAVSLGRSIPQALFAVGSRGPQELRPAFRAAQREWVVSTDFDRTLGVLRSRLADATADAVCETLLVAHEIGGGEVDRRLQALAEDRIQDLHGRKEARAKQAGARFARLFTLGVPVGMALVGLSIGSGRAAYATPLGQIGVAVAFVLMGVCWLWAGRIMRLPIEERVFYDE